MIVRYELFFFIVRVVIEMTCMSDFTGSCLSAADFSIFLVVKSDMQLISIQSALLLFT